MSSTRAEDKLRIQELLASEAQLIERVRKLHNLVQTLSNNVSRIAASAMSISQMNTAYAHEAQYLAAWASTLDIHPGGPYLMPEPRDQRSQG